MYWEKSLIMCRDLFWEEHVYYRHLLQHQYILQRALREAQGVEIIPDDPAAEPIRYSDQALVSELGLETLTAKTLSAFRNFNLPENDFQRFSFTPPNEIASPLRIRSDAEKLWNYLTKHKFIRTAMSRMPIKVDKRMMYARREYGSTISCFFNAHTSQVEEFAQSGLANEIFFGKAGEAKEWFLYKNSFRFENAFVKSNFTIKNVDNQYFEVADRQLSSGTFEDNDNKYEENSNGFAFSKSGNLWCILGEEEYEQPRFFCFYDDHKPANRRDSETFNISHFFGHIMESDLMFRSRFYQSPVVLVSKELEHENWFKSKRRGEFDDRAQIDVHPFDGRQRNPKVYVPDFVIGFLQNVMT